MSEMAKLTRGSIRGHLVSQTMPMIFGVAAIMSVGLIDAYFIGQLGAKELAAVSFIFPITIALSSLGVGVMVGINSVIARALGEGDPARAERRAGGEAGSRDGRELEAPERLIASMGVLEAASSAPGSTPALVGSPG